MSAPPPSTAPEVEGEWHADTVTVRACLVFDKSDFPVGAPTSCPTLTSCLLLKDFNERLRHIQLERCVLTNVTVERCEVKCGDAAQSNPHAFSIKLFDNAGKAIPHDVLNVDGLPIGHDERGPSTYCSRTLGAYDRTLLTNFGNYATRASLDNMLNGGKISPTSHLLTLVEKTQAKPTSERGRGRVADVEELKNLIPIFEKNTKIVRGLFHDMTSVSGEIVVCGNEQTVPEQRTSNLLIRVTVGIEMLAAVSKHK